MCLAQPFPGRARDPLGALRFLSYVTSPPPRGEFNRRSISPALRWTQPWTLAARPRAAGKTSAQRPWLFWQTVVCFFCLSIWQRRWNNVLLVSWLTTRSQALQGVPGQPCKCSEQSCENKRSRLVGRAHQLLSANCPGCPCFSALFHSFIQPCTYQLTPWWLWQVFFLCYAVFSRISSLWPWNEHQFWDFYLQTQYIIHYFLKNG